MENPKQSKDAIWIKVGQFLTSQRKLNSNSRKTSTEKTVHFYFKSRRYNDYSQKVPLLNKTISKNLNSILDTSVGELRIGPNDEREHWKEALAHPNKRIFRWHQIRNPV